MAAFAKPPEPLPERRQHIYHAEASLLEAELEHPFPEKVRPQVHIKLLESPYNPRLLHLAGIGEKLVTLDRAPQSTDRYSHYQFQYSQSFRLGGIMSYRFGYTQLGGHRSSKSGHGFVTLATSVVEGLNILDILTADRVVAQISTEHPVDGAVPSVSFLGTRFENLRIAGRKVEIEMDLDVLGPKPADDQSYLDENSVIDRMARQYEKLSTAANLPDWATERFPRDRAVWQEPNQVQCSLVNSVNPYPGTFGHVIDIPHFGKVFLGELKVHCDKADNPNFYDAYTFSLCMIRMELGCPVIGKARITPLDSNGGGGKP